MCCTSIPYSTIRRKGLTLAGNRRARRALIVSRLPAPDRGSADARAPRHLLHGQAVGWIKDNARPLHMFERTIANRDDGQQTLTIFGGRKDTDNLSHAQSLSANITFECIAFAA